MQFAESKKGYDKAQVDIYLQTVSEACRQLRQEYSELSEKYNTAMQSSRSASESDLRAIAQALIDARQSAKSILDNAQASAAHIVAEAEAEAERILDSVRAQPVTDSFWPVTESPQPVPMQQPQVQQPMQVLTAPLPPGALFGTQVSASLPDAAADDEQERELARQIASIRASVDAMVR